MDSTQDTPRTHFGIGAIASRVGRSRSTLLKWRQRWDRGERGGPLWLFEAVRFDAEGSWLMEESDYRAALDRNTERAR